MNWDIIFERYILFLYIFARMSGMILFNPFFNRNSVPVKIRVGLSLFLSLLLTASMSAVPPDSVNLLILSLACIKELLIGFFVGFLMQMFTASILLAGDFTDLQLGVGMAKVYDPQSSISMPLSGSIYNLIWTVSFFASNGHLTFMRIMFASFDILPAGPALLNSVGYEYIVMFFSNILVLALKMALPVVAIELVTEMGMGILMRAVPQINVFMVGMQLKLLIGLALILLVLPSLFGFFDSMMNAMLQSVYNGLGQLS